MRKRYEIQQSLGCIPIGEVFIRTKSRHQLSAMLVGLQHIFNDLELRDAVLGVVEESIMKDKKRTGRQGMTLWEILVMGVVRLGLSADFDYVEDLANNHKAFRGILGVENTSGFGPEKHYPVQTLKDNLALFDEETLKKVNIEVVKAGHRVLKKKRIRKTFSP